MLLTFQALFQMEKLLYHATFLAALSSVVVLLFACLTNKNGLPRSWPLIGPMLALITNFHRLLEWSTMVVERSGCTIHLKGSWLLPFDMLVTVDPANVQYTSSTKFSNFPRGEKSRELFDVFGDGYFNHDSKEWSNHRRIFRAFFNHKQFGEVSIKKALEKVEKGLIPILDKVANRGAGVSDGTVIDLQEVFQRYTYDLTHSLVTGFDPNSLSLQWPKVPFSTFMNIAMEAVFFRHFLPERVWRIQRFFGLGREGALKKAKEFLNKFSAQRVAMKQNEMEGRGNHGKDTTSAALTWFFWLLAGNPSVAEKIKEELCNNISKDKAAVTLHLFNQEELNKLVYLHAALCETLRLYPPVPFQTRSAIEPDILPTGHNVIPGKTLIIVPLYIMGRMTSIWGKDSQEFKPERWITEKGGIKHEPSHKFFTFNSGPRICLGRELAFVQMKIMAAAIIHNYDVNVLEQDRKPLNSVVLHMKDGLHAKLTKRWD
ncbi:Alkane hydroxylase MAH1-like protein [Drosera capensis]